MYAQASSVGANTQQARRSRELVEQMAINGKRAHDIAERVSSLLVRIAGAQPPPATQGPKDGLAAVPNGLAGAIVQQNVDMAQSLDALDRALAHLEEFV